ncbi:MAG: MerR family transcriptional regulator [Polyangiaceae bacterium]|nr:MerR family transcriptional regulator [Polyangiaceae bacterium]
MAESPRRKAKQAASEQEATLKISDLASRTGLSVPTIHFYMREGLLPPPPRKTSRNMAYYDESFVTRLRLIRRLQEERRLPLRVIRSLIAGQLRKAGDLFDGIEELEAMLLSGLELTPRMPDRSEEELRSRTGIDPEDLAELIHLGLITPRSTPEGVQYSPGDAEIAGIIARARSVGLTRELFPTSDLLLYQRALGALVGQEVRLFVKRMRGRTGTSSLEKQIDAAVHLMGELIVQLRRKLIADLTAGLGREEGEGKDGTRSPPERRTRTGGRKAPAKRRAR